MKTRTLILAGLLVLNAAFASGAGLGTLIDIGESQSEMESELEKETAAYYRVRKGIEDGKIIAGRSQEYISLHFDEPVIVMPAKDSTERWVYKPAYASFFDGIKIYLIFDSDKNLVGIKNLDIAE